MRSRYIKSGDLAYTSTLDDVIISLCRDYDRREDVIRRAVCSERTAIEYRYLNYRIREAAIEIAGERLALPFIEDIGKKIGYARTDMAGFSEADYKCSKRLVKLGIARSLHLFD